MIEPRSDDWGKRKDKIREWVLVFAYSLETRLKKGRHNASTFLRCHVRVITRQFQFLFYFRLVNISKGKRLLVHFLPSSSHSARAEQRASKEKNFRAYSNEQKKKRKGNRNWNKKKILSRILQNVFAYTFIRSFRDFNNNGSQFSCQTFCQSKAPVKKRRIVSVSNRKFNWCNSNENEREKKRKTRKSISFNKLATKRWYSCR